MSPIDLSSEPALTRLQRLARGAPSGRRNLFEVLVRASQVLAIRLVGAGLTYTSMVLLARWLGPHDFGIYAYVLVIVTLLGLAFRSASVRRGCARPEPIWRAGSCAGWPALSEEPRHGARFQRLRALCCAALVLVFRDAIESYYVVPLLVGLLCVPIWTLPARSSPPRVRSAG